jgi:hypothetical protein
LFRLLVAIVLLSGIVTLTESGANAMRLENEPKSKNFEDWTADSKMMKRLRDELMIRLFEQAMMANHQLKHAPMGRRFPDNPTKFKQDLYGNYDPYIPTIRK